MWTVYEMASCLHPDGFLFHGFVLGTSGGEPPQQSSHRRSPHGQFPYIVMHQGTERADVYFVMDAVAGARRTPGRHETGGVPPKSPATTLLSLWPLCVLGLRFAPPEASRRHFSRAVAAAVFSFPVVAKTPASCRGTSRQNITLRCFCTSCQFRTS